MAIIDIHTHILYGIDDGADDREMSLQLMGMAYKQGVRGIFCTNHSSHYMEYSYNDYYSRFDYLNRQAADKYPGLYLYKGCEMACTKAEMPQIISNIQRGVFPTMNGTSYVLMEFSPHRTKGMEEMQYCLEYAQDKGYLPIIAHAERYKPIYDDPLSDIMKLKKSGFLVQINLFSVEQDHGSRKELANLFLANQLVDFVGTDTHSTYYKSPEAAVGAAALREKYGNEYADKVLFKNAEELLINSI